MAGQESYDPNSERQLLSRLANGDEVAFREIVKRYKHKLDAFVLQMTRSTVMTEEIVQDSFLQVWLTREGLGNIDSFPKFLFILCRNKAINAFRKTLREREKQRELHQSITYANTDIIPYEEDVLIDLVQEAVNQLTPQQKKAWEMSRREGRKHAQIADAMQISQETVKKHIQYANASIIAYLKARKDFLLWISWFIYNR
jgi:RNA polymerase sigma-70 factor (ECF subfamily)